MTGPFLECPKCHADQHSITRIGVRQFECLVCAELFDLQPANDDHEPRAKPSGRVKAMQTGRKDQDE